MSHGELCPVCAGRGEFSVPSKELSVLSTALVVTIIQCHGCRGLGWVRIDDKAVTQPILIQGVR